MSIPKFDGRIEIKPRTTAGDIFSWASFGNVEISINRGSSFEFGAESFALAFLSSSRKEGVRFDVYVEFNEPRTERELEGSVFGTAFGYSLVRLAKTIQFNSGLAGNGFKSLLSALYKERKGAIGLGRKVSLVCLDPVSPMPEAFGMGVETDESGSYPTPFGFSQVLARQAEKIGLSGGFGSSKERSLIEFLYETFRNSIEHGYHDPASFPRSTRAVIIEKLPAPDEQALPGGMSYEVGSYLRRMLSSSSHELGFGFVSISVVDQGFGIQNTMPRLDSEEDKDVFCRAFRRGESRKPNGFVKRGLGLDNALAAAMSIGAFVRIASGGLYCEIDYSKDENKYPGISKSLLKNIDCGWNGTVFSILMPDFSSDKDQGGLF